MSVLQGAREAVLPPQADDYIVAVDATPFLAMLLILLVVVVLAWIFLRHRDDPPG